MHGAIAGPGVAVSAGIGRRLDMAGLSLVGLRLEGDGLCLFQPLAGVSWLRLLLECDGVGLRDRLGVVRWTHFLAKVR